jgi:hypothetical protein
MNIVVDSKTIICQTSQSVISFGSENNCCALNFTTILNFQVDWYLAKLECKVKGMELISIESQEEQDALATTIGAPLYTVTQNIAHFHVF